MKPLFSRPQVARDLEEYYTRIAADNPRAADDWYAAVQSAFRFIAQNPALGWRRRFRSPLLRGVRSRSVRPFNHYLIFYLEHPAHVEILRVLHGARDLPRRLAEHP